MAAQWACRAADLLNEDGLGDILRLSVINQEGTLINDTPYALVAIWRNCRRLSVWIAPGSYLACGLFLLWMTSWSLSMPFLLLALGLFLRMPLARVIAIWFPLLPLLTGIYLYYGYLASTAKFGVFYAIFANIAFILTAVLLLSSAILSSNRARCWFRRKTANGDDT